MQAENQTERELTDMLTAKELLGRAQALEPQLVSGGAPCTVTRRWALI